MGQVKIDIKTEKTNWSTDIILILFFQLTFYCTPIVTIYAFVTLNWNLIGLLFTFVILQQIVTKSEYFVRMVNKYVQPLRYFKRFIRIYDEPIDEENETTMYCFHPHSQFSFGVLANMNADSSKMSSMIGLCSRFALLVPYTGLQFKLWGAQGVNKSNLIRLMKEKKTLAIVPGGFQEATLTTPNQIRVYIKKRYGFLKYALRHGYTVRPTLIYNEHKAFKTFDHLRNFRLLLNKLKIPSVFFFGGFLQFFFPIGLEMITIVGKGIKRDPTKQGLPVTIQQIHKSHQNYINQIKRLHSAYKDKYNEAPLVIF